MDKRYEYFKAVKSYNFSNDRMPLNRKRLENAHLRYAVLVIQRSFPDVFGSMFIASDVHDTLKEINVKFSAAMQKTYSGTV